MSCCLPDDTSWLKKGSSRNTKTIFFFFLVFFRAALAAYGGSQARGQIGAADAGLHHSHSNVESEPHL